MYQFNVIAIDIESNKKDSRFNKKFERMREAEAFFGLSLLSSNVSEDGVLRFYPSDTKTEEALISYRQVRYAELNAPPIDQVFPEELEVGNDMVENPDCPGVWAGLHCWAMRGSEHVNMARTALCEAEDNHTLTQCRQDVLMVISGDNSTVFIRDLSRDATAFSDLLERPMEPVNGRTMELLVTNEDTGATRRYPMGTYAGPQSQMDRLADKIGVTLGEYGNVSLTWKNHKNDPVIAPKCADDSVEIISLRAPRR